MVSHIAKTRREAGCALHLYSLRSFRCASLGNEKAKLFRFARSLHRILASPKAICSPRKWECKHSHSARLHCIDKPDSGGGSHVSGMNVAIHLKRLSQSCRAKFLKLSAARPSTVLHAGRIFAVAPPCFHEAHPDRVPSLSALASLFASLGSPQAGVTRYPAPLSLRNVGVSGLSSSPCGPAAA